MENTEMTQRERIVEEEIAAAKARAESRIEQLEKQPLVDQYVAELTAHQGQGSKVGQRIRAKYKNLGLDTDRVSVRFNGS